PGDRCTRAHHSAKRTTGSNLPAIPLFSSLPTRPHPLGVDMLLEDKVALITGASSGIGARVAARFVAEGAKVAANYLPDSRKDREPSETAGGSSPTKSIAVYADVAKRDQVEAMVARVDSELGGIAICLNNAGIEIRRPFLETTDDEWNRVLSVNTYGSF